MHLFLHILTLRISLKDSCVSIFCNLIEKTFWNQHRFITHPADDLISSCDGWPLWNTMERAKLENVHFKVPETLDQCAALVISAAADCSSCYGYLRIWVFPDVRFITVIFYFLFFFLLLEQVRHNWWYQIPACIISPAMKKEEKQGFLAISSWHVTYFGFTFSDQMFI